MRKSLLILLAVEIAVAIAIGQVGHVDRPEMARAFVAWQQNPTPESRHAFETEKRIADLERWGFSGVVFAFLAGVTVFVYRMRRGEQAATPNNRPPSQLPTSPDVQSSDSQRTSSFGGCG
jgi:hypothetical protein